MPIEFNKEADLLHESNNDFLTRFSRQFNKENPIIKSIEEGKELLVSNLIKIQFPVKKLFIAPVNYDRNKVIENSWQTKTPLNYKATARQVARNAIYQQGLNFSSDWTIFKNQVVAFHNLNDKAIPLSRIIDSSRIEEDSIQDFYEIDEDHKSVFKTLLRFCLQQKLYKVKYEWENEDGIFRFIAPQPIEKNFEQKERWVADKKAKRTVFKARFYPKGNRYYCTHFAFAVSFRDFDDEWYLCVNPTWAISINGKNKSKVSHKTVSKIKRLERNRSVLNHLRYIYYQLNGDMFIASNYPFMHFDFLQKFKIDHAINDSLWAKNENEDEKQTLEDEEAPNDIKDENTLFG